MKKTSGFFNYMSSSCQSSLFRNGKVLTRRDISGSDAESVGIELEKYKMDFQTMMVKLMAKMCQVILIL
jgi:hypothetical protein